MLLYCYLIKANFVNPACFTALFFSCLNCPVFLLLYLSQKAQKRPSFERSLLLLALSAVLETRSAQLISINPNLFILDLNGLCDDEEKGSVSS